jgi:transcriptional regulator with XRE-family HTH domain
MDEDDHELLDEIGRRIAYLRKKAGLTQIELSVDAHMAKSYLSDIERGKRNPTVTTLSRLLDALGYDLPSFFTSFYEDMSEM